MPSPNKVTLLLVFKGKEPCSYPLCTKKKYFVNSSLYVACPLPGHHDGEEVVWRKYHLATTSCSVVLLGPQSSHIFYNLHGLEFFVIVVCILCDFVGLSIFFTAKKVFLGGEGSSLKSRVKGQTNKTDLTWLESWQLLLAGRNTTYSCNFYSFTIENVCFECCHVPFLPYLCALYTTKKQHVELFLFFHNQRKNQNK